MDIVTISFYSLFLFFALGVVTLLIITGMFFLIKAKQKRMTNLVFLAVSVLLVATGFIANYCVKVNENFIRAGNIIQEPFIIWGFFFFVLFTNTTFYKNQMKTGNILFAVVIVLGLSQLILMGAFGSIEIDRGFEYYLRVSLDFPFAFITFNWLTYSCYSTYNRLKEMDIEPWIKARYKYLAISSFIVSFYQVPEFFQPRGVRWGTPSDPLSLTIFGTMMIIMMFYIVIFSLTWFMPKRLKRHFNKGYIREDEKECTEENLLNYLNKKLKG